MRSGLKRFAATGGNITLEVNGKPAQLSVTPDTTLLQAVRESLNLTGAKEVCDRGACGACTMLVDGRSVNSCMMLAIDAVGQEDHDGRRAHEGRPARPRAAGVCRARRLPVRVLHSRASSCGRGRCWMKRPSRAATRSSTACAATSAAVRRTCESSPPSRPRRKEARHELPRWTIVWPWKTTRPRLDIVEKVNGTAKYTTDYYLPNMMWAAYIRSDFGDAQLRSSNVEAARAVKGVLEVEIDKEAGRYHGDRLGHVCAESRQALEQALDGARFEVRGPLAAARGSRTSARRSTDLKPADNDADAQKALDESEVVAEAEFQTQVQTHVVPGAARLRRRLSRRLGRGLRLDAEQLRLSQRPGARAGPAARPGRVPLRVRRRRIRQQVRRRQRRPARRADEQEIQAARAA